MRETYPIEFIMPININVLNIHFRLPKINYM